MPGQFVEGGSMRSCKDDMGRSRMCCVMCCRMCCVIVVALLKRGCCGLVVFSCCMQRASTGEVDPCEGVYVCVLVGSRLRHIVLLSCST